MSIGGVYLFEGSTLFLASCAGGHLGLANTLADRGSDVNAVCSNSKRSALMYACRYGHRVVAVMLLDRGINLEARDNGEWTALHFAAYYDHPDTCLLLISRGIDLMAVDYGNLTALDLYGCTSFAIPPLMPALHSAMQSRRSAVRF